VFQGGGFSKETTGTVDFAGTVDFEGDGGLRINGGLCRHDCEENWFWYARHGDM